MNASSKTMAGRYRAGLAAEDQVAREYVARGCKVLEQRWCALGGELDLVLASSCGLIICEVKQAKTIAAGLLRVTPKKQGRIIQTTQAYLAQKGFDQSTEIQFDVAVQDATGKIHIVENAMIM